MSDTIIRVRASHAAGLAVIAICTWSLTLLAAAKLGERMISCRIMDMVQKQEDAARHQRALCLHTFMTSNLRQQIDVELSAGDAPGGVRGERSESVLYRQTTAPAENFSVPR